MDFRIVSIGTLAVNTLWREREPTRTGHATTSLIREDGRTILVDPGLPTAALEARLDERAGIKPAAVTHVFLTSFQPDTIRGIQAFPDATWWIGEREREGVGVPLAAHLKRAHEQGDHELVRLLERDVAILQRCKPAPDELCPGVSLFPLPGVTPGLTGLLLAEHRATTLITGDAIATREHLDKGQVLPHHADLEQARESFAEAVEIADLLVLGRDGLVVNPTKRPF